MIRSVSNVRLNSQKFVYSCMSLYVKIGDFNFRIHIYMIKGYITKVQVIKSNTHCTHPVNLYLTKESIVNYMGLHTILFCSCVEIHYNTLIINK